MDGGFFRPKEPMYYPSVISLHSSSRQPKRYSFPRDRQHNFLNPPYFDSERTG